MAGCFDSNLPFEMVPHHTGFQGVCYSCEGRVLEPEDEEQVCVCVGERRGLEEDVKNQHVPYYMPPCFFQQPYKPILQMRKLRIFPGSLSKWGQDFVLFY